MPEDQMPYDGHLPSERGDTAAFLAEIVGRMELAERDKFAEAMKWALSIGDEERIRFLIESAMH